MPESGAITMESLEVRSNVLSTRKHSTSEKQEAKCELLSGMKSVEAWCKIGKPMLLHYYFLVNF